MKFYGINGPILQWTAAFLGNMEQCVMVDGAKSKPTRVESGVPQGTALGPLLFLLHINDLPGVVSSQVRQFADDCLIYWPIRVRDDQVSFQQDLLALERWGDTWGMRFNAKKCYIMHISRSTSPLTNFYSLCNQVLQSVDDVKYLGVTLTSELSWSPHIDHITHRANSTLGFLRRNLNRCPSKLKETAYLSLCSSVLEYAAPIWDPFLSKDKNSLECACAAPGC